MMKNKTLIKVLIGISLVAALLLFQLIKMNKVEQEALEKQNNEIDIRLKQDSLNKKLHEQEMENWGKDLKNVY